MARPRTSDGLKPPLEVRHRIAAAVGRKWYRPLFENHLDDAQQIAWLAACTQTAKHLTIPQFRKLANRVWYAEAKNYNMTRRYLPGNRKAALAPREEQYPETAAKRGC